MSSSNYSINHNAVLAGVDEDVSVAYALLKTDDGYVVSTLANRTAEGRRSDGIAITASSNGGAVAIAHDGLVDAEHTGLPDGDAGDWVIVADNGTLERVATVAGGDDIIGRCPGTNGDAHISPGTWDSDNYAGGGGGGGATLPIDLTTDVTGALPVANGGTGATSLTSGNLLIGQGTSPISSFAMGSGVQTFLTTPSGANLAAALTSAIPVTKGGTGATSFTSGRILYGNGTSAINESGSNLSYNGTTLTANNIATGGIVWDGSLASGGSNCVSDNSGVHDWLVCRLASDLSSRGVISFDFDKVTFGSDYAGLSRMPTTEVRGNEVYLFASSGGSSSGYIKLTSAGIFVQDSTGGGKFLKLVVPALAADRTLNFPALTGSDTLAVLGLAQTWTGVQSFTTPKIADSAGGQFYSFAVSNLAADRTITLPLLTGNDTFVFEAHSQTLTNKTISGASNTLTVRLANDVTGTLPVGNGGTGATSFTANRVLFGNGSSAIATDANFTFNSGSALCTIGANLAVGSGTPATAGAIRMVAGTGIKIRNGAGTADLDLIRSSSDFCYVGDAARNDAGLLFYSGGDIVLNTNSTMTFGLTQRGLAQASGWQFGPGSADHGGGTGVLGIDNATVNPSTNPTGGGILYADAGAGKWRGSGGTVTTFGPADPHCPTCGRDFATEHRNDDMGEHLAVCLSCLIDTLKAAGIDTAKFAMVDKRSKTKAQWDDNHARARARDAQHAADEAERVRNKEKGTAP